ncbi:MAG: GspE/PulE family protein [Pseudobdellovibrionaceae bacterium]
MSNYKLRTTINRPANATDTIDYLLTLALKSKASDIHLSINQPTELNPDPYMFRLRVDGKLQVHKCGFLNGFYSEVLARFKVLASMSTTDVGVPLDGQMIVDSPQGQTVLRISTVPCQDEEELVIRIQNNNSIFPSIDKLQMTREMKSRLGSIIRQKSGLILITGPAGSGKTTTIYSMINSIASPDKKIITAEDPIETRLPYVNHTQVSRKADFATLGRSFMRQDAEVIFIGEVRDAESAQSALQLAQTGHLVLTTLHTRDSIGTISRLEALGIHSNSIATTLIGSLSQRLIPALCKSCKVPHNLDSDTLHKLSDIMPLIDGYKIFQAGPGCDSCTNGYAGRLPIFELLVVDPVLSDAIDRKKSKLEILELARRKGMLSLAQEALIRVYSGYIDLRSVESYLVGPSYDT